MKDEKSSIVRIIKHEALNGTYYIPQRKVKKWFGGWKWESFGIKCERYSDKEFIERLYYFDYTNELFKSTRVAEMYCERYVRINVDNNKVVKVWSIEDES